MLKKRPVAPAMAHTPRLEGRVRTILGYLPTRPTRGIGVGLVLAGLATVPLLAARSTPLPQTTAEKAPVTTQLPPPRIKAPEKAHAKVRVQRVAKAQADAALIEKRLRNDALLADARKQRVDAESAKRKMLLEEARAGQDRKREQERKMREFRLEPIREELDELKLKLRELNSRLTDKQLELAAVREEVTELDDRARGLKAQINVLEKMIEVTRRKREELRDHLMRLSNEAITP